MNEPTELCKLAHLYGTDKCPRLKHFYTPYYYKLLVDRCQTIKKVLEMGIGYYKNMQHVEVVYDRGLRRKYRRGASLKMWRDFFPNAQIYGADILPETMFEDERIKTFLCDETKKKDLVGLIEKTGSDIDLFIDDGSHKEEHQIFMCQTLMPLLKKDVIYIIEDIVFPSHITNALSQYDCQIPKIPRKYKKSRLAVIKNYD